MTTHSQVANLAMELGECANVLHELGAADVRESLERLSGGWRNEAGRGEGWNEVGEDGEEVVGVELEPFLVCT
jgi:hypothetical protein